MKKKKTPLVVAAPQKSMKINFDAKTLHKEYIEAKPFPSIVIDNFLDDSIIEVPKEIRAIPDNIWHQEDHQYQQKKFWLPDTNVMPPKTRELVKFLNSPETCRWLSELSGIPNLISDPTLLGGGIHRIRYGGKLGIHADFNIHNVNKLHRRINLLLYLNEAWHESWGGFLELWERDMSKCVRKIEPFFNRAVVFTITDDAFHGHPDPLLGPERISIATYYYTTDRPEHEKAAFHWAAWRDTPKK